MIFIHIHELRYGEIRILIPGPYVGVSLIHPTNLTPETHRNHPNAIQLVTHRSAQVLY